MEKTDSQPVEVTVEQKEAGIDRRQVLRTIALGAAGVAAATTLSGCLGDGTPTSSGVVDPTANNNTSGSGSSSSTVIGSFENPYSQDQLGDYATGADARVPRIFGALISNVSYTTQTARLWVEVMGTPAATATDITSAQAIGFDVLAAEQLCTDGVTEIRIVDEDTKEVLAARSLKATFQARFITTLSFNATTHVAAYAYIESKGGWWKGSVYNVSDLTVRNAASSGTSGCVGSLRQPLTRHNHGSISVAKTYKHQGIWQSIGLSGARWIFADSDGTTPALAHTDFSVAGHHFLGAYVFDQNDQLIENTAYTWCGGTLGSGTTSGGKIAATGNTAIVDTAWSHLNNTGTAITVPYLNFATLPQGVTSLRIVWLCSLDGWWESRIGVI